MSFCPQYPIPQEAFLPRKLLPIILVKSFSELSWICAKSFLSLLAHSCKFKTSFDLSVCMKFSLYLDYPLSPISILTSSSQETWNIDMIVDLEQNQ